MPTYHQSFDEFVAALELLQVPFTLHAAADDNFYISITIYNDDHAAIRSVLDAFKIRRHKTMTLVYPTVRVTFPKSRFGLPKDFCYERHSTKQTDAR